MSSQQGGDCWLCRFNVRLNPAVFCKRCLCAVPFLTVPWTTPYRDGYYCANNGSEIMRIDTYCGPQWGIWICIVRNSTGRAAATIASLATDMILKVSIDSYLGQQHSVKMFSNRLSIVQHIFYHRRWLPID